ncbi:MAG: hypothetical protein KAG64_00120 [Bacteroidales bacterium]|nr:hypothetical protein [Bacteroidales bacterium]
MKINGEVIQAKIIDTEGNVIRFNKYNETENTLYIITKDQVALIKYKTGEIQKFISSKSVQAETAEVSSAYTKKTFFLGGHFAIGNGAVQNDVLGFFDFNKATNFGAELGYYFNNVLGLKTGVSYLTIPYGKHDEKSTSLLGIPTTMVVSIGNKVGFYTEIGAVFYFQSNNNNPIIAAENMIGFHMTSDNIDFKLGFLLNFTFKEKPKELNTGSVFMGINAGISIYL